VDRKLDWPVGNHALLQMVVDEREEPIWQTATFENELFRDGKKMVKAMFFVECEHMFRY